MTDSKFFHYFLETKASHINKKKNNPVETLTQAFVQFMR